MYGNRTDLAAATGLPYGEKQKLMQAVAQTPPQQQGQVSAQGGAPQQESLGDPVAAAQAWSPRKVTPLTAPTGAPAEPLMAAPQQPVQRAPSPLVAAVGLLNSLGANVPPEVKALRAAAQAAQLNQGAP